MVGMRSLPWLNLSANLIESLITREEGCDQEGGKDGYACLVRKLQLDESKAQKDGQKEKTKKARSGAKQGLQVILDQHSNLDSVATHFDADNSFKVYVGQPTVIIPKRGTNSSPDFTASLQKQTFQRMVKPNSKFTFRKN